MCVRTSKTFYGSFILAMGRSPGFGSAPCDLCPFQTWFPSGSGHACPSPCHRAQLAGPFYKKYAVALSRVALPPVVNTGVQVLFHSPPGVLFTFPSRYCPLSVTGSYSALGGGPPDFPQGFPCLVVLWILLCCLSCLYGALTLSGRLSQNRSSSINSITAVRNPGEQALRFGLFRVRSPLLAESMFLSLPLPT